MADADPTPITLDGSSLTIEQLAHIARDPRVSISPSDVALAAVDRGRRQIEAVVDDCLDAVAAGRSPIDVYGVTTGFGSFKNQRISDREGLEDLQRNILLSHAVGLGENADADDPGNYFSAEVVRATLVLRLNTFLRGHSGVRRELVEFIAELINDGVIPLVPLKGSLGSSGDLCPLAHLFGVLVGQGRYYRVKTPEDMLVRARSFEPVDAYERNSGEPTPQPSYKEGLALTNGATFTAAMLALAVHDAASLANVADIAATMSLEAVCGRTRALDPRVHEDRGQGGQIDSAANCRALLVGKTCQSRLVDRVDDVQDAYSLRCAPQVHGASRDAIAYAMMVVGRELNATTDNPLFFPDDRAPWDVERFAANRPDGQPFDTQAYSAGNFHGQPLALASDFLTIALAELADISERRIQLLLDSHHNRGLPANLIPDPGLNSGFMLAQYSAASVVSENKVLSHPASVDSIPTSAGVEDHVAMATHAARKLLTVLHNTQAVLAIELLVATQALEWRVALLETNDGKVSGADPQRVDFAAATLPERRETVVSWLGPGSRAAYQAVRDHAGVEPMLADRVLDEDIRAIRRMLEDGSLAAMVQSAVDNGVRTVQPLGSSDRS